MGKCTPRGYFQYMASLWLDRGGEVVPHRRFKCMFSVNIDGVTVHGAFVGQNGIPSLGGYM